MWFSTAHWMECSIKICETSQTDYNIFALFVTSAKTCMSHRAHEKKAMAMTI